MGGNVELKSVHIIEKNEEGDGDCNGDINQINYNE